MPKSPGFLGYTALLGDGSVVENRPSKLQQTWGILGPYITKPVTGAINWTRNMFESDPYTLLTDTGPRAQALGEGGAEVATNFMGASSVVPKPRNALNMGFRVFHGSPHDFPPVRLIEMSDGTRLYQNMHELPDTPHGAKIIQEFPLGRFDLSKIGTGEGAQAYGHGLYFAENPKIAEFYKTNLGRNYILKETGQPIDWNNPEHVAAASVFVANGDRAKAIQANRAFPAYGVLSGDAANLLESGAAIPEVITQQPRMYEVEINADPNAFLDWDKPLSEQPESVQKGFGDLVNRDLSKETGWGKLTGQEGLDAIMERYGSLDWPVGANATLRQQYRTNARSKASALLADKGIPGIKYLDAGSRGAGDGTRNYVVFDDNLISIVRKYGIAGASAMLGYNILQNATPAQAEELRKLEPTR